MLTKCICGGSEYREFSKEYYEVTSLGKTRLSKREMGLAECSDCGIVRQLYPPFENEEECREYYKKYPPTQKKYKTKTYNSDKELASLRFDEYGITRGEKILDIGSGSGAFVDACRAKEVSAFGCEMAQYHFEKQRDFVYPDRFENVNFPTDHFDKVVCHDTLEHILDPVKFLEEMFRSVAQLGICIIDLPDFFVNEGKHHWKREHIWYFSVEQLKTILEKIGFVITQIKHPIESKVVFYCTKLVQERPKILFPPGMGDAYWSVVKLQSFLKRENLGLPDIHIVSNKEKREGHKRAFPFLEMFPFLNSTTVTYSSGKSKDLQYIWKEAYAEKGRTIFKDVYDCDYFIAYNGYLRFGESLENIDPDLECNWFPPMFCSLEQDRYKNYCMNQYGRYIVFYFVFQGTYAFWTKEFSIGSVIDFVKKTCERTGCVPVFVGALWDTEDSNLNRIKTSIPNVIDLIGKTSVEQLFGLIRGAQMVVGYPSGLSILSTTLKQRTLIIWNDYYDRRFARNACPPSTWKETYFIENTKGMNINSVAEMASAIVGGEKPSIRHELENPKPARRQVEKKSVDINVKFPPLMKEKVKIGSHRRSSFKKSILEKPVEVETSSNIEPVVICVLKTGGSYTDKYVEVMEKMVSKNITLLYKFVVLSDSPKVKNKKNLEFNFPGWWSKLELFRLIGPCLYFDLDTIILRNIDPLVRVVQSLEQGEMRMLTPFNPRKRARGEFASGIMAWHGDFSVLIKEITDKKMWKYDDRRGGDQLYIFETLRKHSVPIRPIEKYLKIYSFKRHCLDGLPRDADIVCFHGSPRPHEIKGVDWVSQYWRES